MFKAKIKKLFDAAKIPTKAHPSDAAFDLYAFFDESAQDGVSVEIIPAGETRKVGTGIAITPPDGYFGAVFPRSGLSTKQGLRLANSTGIIDPHYTGEIIVALHNDSKENQSIAHGDRIAQLMFLPVLETEFEEVENLDDTDRGATGFGDSGKS